MPYIQVGDKIEFIQILLWVLSSISVHRLFLLQKRKNGTMKLDLEVIITVRNPPFFNMN